MSPAMKTWLIGLANAGVSAIASGTTSIAFGVDWKKSLGIAGVSALASVIKWMAQHPIPDGSTPTQPPAGGGQ